MIPKKGGRKKAGERVGPPPTRSVHAAPLGGGGGGGGGAILMRGGAVFFVTGFKKTSMDDLSRRAGPVAARL